MYTCQVFRGIRLEHSKGFDCLQEAANYKRQWESLKVGGISYDVVITENNSQKRGKQLIDREERA